MKLIHKDAWDEWTTGTWVRVGGIVVSVLAALTLVLVVWIHTVDINADRRRCFNSAETLTQSVRWQYNSYWSQDCLVQLSSERWVSLDYYLTYLQTQQDIDLSISSGAVK